MARGLLCFYEVDQLGYGFNAIYFLVIRDQVKAGTKGNDQGNQIKTISSQVIFEIHFQHNIMDIHI